MEDVSDEFVEGEDAFYEPEEKGQVSDTGTIVIDDKKETEKIAAGHDANEEALSSIDIDRNLIKKRGFLISFNNVAEPQATLDEEIKQTNARYDELIKAYRETQQSRITNLEEINSRNIKLLAELDLKKSEYETHVRKEVPQAKEALAKEIAAVHGEVFKTLKEIGQLKETVANSSINGLEAQLKKVIQINRELQNEQNKAIAEEFKSDKVPNDLRVEFFSNLLKTYQGHYDLTAERLKLLSKDGINSQTSTFLLFLGTIAALVAGWWFSVWTGPLAGSDAHVSVVNNSDVRFFVLDNLGRYLAAQTLSGILLALGIYVLAVGLVSWACYALMRHFGFIEKGKKKDKKGPGTEGTEDDIDFDLQGADDILNARFKGQNWWSFWLKIAPFIAATVPVLSVISRQANSKPGSFQNLFDSMMNQFMGTCIAISCSVFTILFFSRVTENAYHEGNINKKRLRFTFLLGFIIFALMIGSMFLYRTAFITDFRTVSILGFLVSCTATGFSLGYGYLFRSLEQNSEALLSRIDLISSIIDHYSKPFRVNYTTNKWLRTRIYILQQKMLDVIQNRQEMAGAIAGGYKLEITQPKKMDKEPVPVPVVPNKAPKSLVGELFDGFINIWKFKKKNDQDKAEAAANEHKIAHQLSEMDLRYFSEKSEQISQLNENLRELKLRRKALEDEELNYLRNQGTWASIKSQISNMEQKKSYLANLLSKTQYRMLKETKKLDDLKKEEVTLLTEGYYTGLWFKDIDKNNNQKLVWS